MTLEFGKARWLRGQFKARLMLVALVVYTAGLSGWCGSGDVSVLFSEMSKTASEWCAAGQAREFLVAGKPRLGEARGTGAEPQVSLPGGEANSLEAEARGASPKSQIWALEYIG